MTKLFADSLAYFKAVFVEAWQKVFTLFDILGIALFFSPTLAKRLVNDESLARTVGGLVFFSSFLLANFSLYRKLAKSASHAADVRLEIEERRFGHSRGSKRSPFREVQANPGGFDKQGLPDWVSLWACIRVTNTGYEEGQLVWELNRTRTKLPPLFASNRTSVEFYPPTSVAGRTSSKADFFFDVLLTERDPYAFAQALRDLVKSKQQYQVVLRYRTRRVDGESKSRELRIKGNFQNLHQTVVKYWREHGFENLVDLAQVA